jgi:hypothetical protein
MFQEIAAPFFADFSQPVTIAGVETAAIYDEKYESVLGMGGGRPALLFPSSAVPFAAVGDYVTVGGISFVIAEVDRSDPLVTVAVLREA